MSKLGRTHVVSNRATIPPRSQSRIAAERSLRAHLARTPSLASQVWDRVRLEDLSDDTASIVGLTIEYPALAANADDLFDVAAEVGADDETLGLIASLTDLPAWVLDNLPSFTDALDVLAKPLQVPPTEALSLWRREVESRKRTRTTFDPLWTAACLEAQARDDTRDGLIAAANAARQKAALILASGGAAPEKESGSPDVWASVRVMRASGDLLAKVAR